MRLNLLFAALISFDLSTALFQPSKRDIPCSPQNMKPDVSRFDCNTKNHLDSDGHCRNGMPTDPTKTNCGNYCEVRLTQKWGQEVPFQVSPCLGPMTCTLSNSFSITTTQTWSVNAGISISKREASKVAFVDLEALKKRNAANPTLLKAAFDLGATYSFSESLGYTVGETKTEALDKNQCGYWTFVPYTIESCGSYTVAPRLPVPGGKGGGPQVCNPKGKLKTVGNWCNIVPYKTPEDKAAGQILFVKTNCATGGVLPKEQQEQNTADVYFYPGVATGQFA